MTKKDLKIDSKLMEAKKFDDFVMKLIHELGEMNIDELESLRPLWMEELENQGVDEKTKFFCSSLIGLIIQKKKEKGRGTV